MLVVNDNLEIYLNKNESIINDIYSGKSIRNASPAESSPYYSGVSLSNLAICKSFGWQCDRQCAQSNDRRSKSSVTDTVICTERILNGWTKSIQ